MAVSDLLEQCAVLEDAMSTSHVAIKPVKYSCRRNIPGPSAQSTCGPCALPHGQPREAHWVASPETTRSSKRCLMRKNPSCTIRRRRLEIIHGVSSEMKMFRYMYGLCWAEYTDETCRQHVRLERLTVASMAVATLNGKGLPGSSDGLSSWGIYRDQ